MLYSLDLSLFKNGFSIKQFNCIDIPICAAAGNSSVSDYYLMGLLLGIRYNRGRFRAVDDESEQQDGLGIYEKCLADLGFSLIRETLHEKEAWLQCITQHLSRHEPVLLAVQYRELYYSIYYRDPEGDRYHLLLVDRYNSETGIMTVRDSSALNSVKLLDSDACVLFPVAVKQDDAWEFWSRSEYFKTDGYLGNYQLFAVGREQAGVQFPAVFRILEQSLQTEKSRLALMIHSYNSTPAFFTDQYSVSYTRLIGSISGMFHAVRYFCGKENISCGALSEIEDALIAKRKKLLNHLTKYSVKKAEIPQEQVDRLAAQAEEDEQKYFSQLIAFVRAHFTETDSMQTVQLDLHPYMNNKAVADNTEPFPDISGTGIFFVLSGQTLRKNCAQHPIPYDLHALSEPHDFDNISCTGQHIPAAHPFRRICILACAEYGSFEESVILLNHGTEVERIPFAVSDFYMAPVFDENAFCTGRTFQREHGSVRELNFSAKIFAYQLPVRAAQFNEIVLPNRKNIHIFAVTLLC